jgi:hypothetical protein
MNELLLNSLENLSDEESLKKKLSRGDIKSHSTPVRETEIAQLNV